MRKTYIGTTLINDIYVGLDKSTMPVLETIGVDYVIAAGGGGGGASGGGGGGGEVATNYFTGSQLNLINTVTYEIVVGDGGAHGDASTAGGQPNPGAGSNGEDSYLKISGSTEIVRAIGGGGGGGTYWDVSRSNLVTSEKNGRDGGSGGGGALLGGIGGSATGSHYGLDGGNNSLKFAANSTCSPLTSSLTPANVAKQNSAGGGAAVNTLGFNIGAAARLPFTGSDGAIWFDCYIPSASANDDQWPLGGQGASPFYIPWVKTASTEVGAGGGGGETVTLRVGTVETDGRGGEGGGTTGGDGGGGGQNPFGGKDATPNSGAGGGGGGLSNLGTSYDYYVTTQGGNGGSGIVSIRYPEPQRFTGGDVLIEDGYVYHTFLSSSILTPTV